MTKGRKTTTRTEAAVTYTRVSTTEQAQSGLGLDDQLAAVTRWCASAALPLAASFSDEGLSGTSMSKRQGLADALAMLANGQASTLVVKNTSRLGRKTTDVLAIADLAQRQGWALVVVDLGLDTSTITGRLTLSLLAAVAEHEAGQISERTKAALAQAKARGTVLGRPKTVDATTIRTIIEQRQSGKSWRAVAAHLNVAGIPTGQKNGAEWAANTARRIYERDAADQ